MTSRTRNTIKINSKDLFLAAEIAANSIPCSGSLKQKLYESYNEGLNLFENAQTAHCVMGCVYQAVANRRHIGFEAVVNTFDTHYTNGEFKDLSPESLLAEELAETTGMKLNENLVKTNDDRFVIPKNGSYLSNFSEKQLSKARNWQVKVLTKMAKKLQKKESK